jgi:hypothetical protein
MSAIMPRTARARPAQAKRRRRSRVSWSSREGIGSRQPVRACSYCVIARSCATRAMRSWPGSEGGRRASNTVPLAEFMVLRNAGRFCRWDVASCAPHAPCRSRCLRRRGLVYGRPCDTPTSRPAPRTVRDSLNVRLWWNRSDWSEAVSSSEAPVQGCRGLGGRAAPQVRDRPPPHRWRSDPGVVGIRLSGSGLCRRHGPTEILDFSAPEAPRYGPSSLLSRGRGLVLGWSSDEHAHTVTTVSGYGDLEVRPVGRGPEWSRGALARMAESMTCPECHVVGGLRLEWNGAFGAFSCEACSPAKR